MKHSPALHAFDPQAFGFKSGLEVHQQLLTEHKLFCRCPAGIYSDDYDAQALRHMRPTLSELGEYDGTALMEFKTKKDIIYRLNKRSVCTYEMDDNPPFLINQQAVDIAIEIALLLNCSIVGELHVARKQYLDGSIPAGFQRTAIVGLNGWIPFKDRKVGIIQLAVEEDACREVSDVGHLRIYATDRLSMPLIEVVTAPDMRTPQEVAEVGYILGNLLRMTNKVRRGIGSVRQDVNVSVEGGTRIEIKGVPRIPLFPALTFHEAYRQHRLLVLRERMLGRGLDKDTDPYPRWKIENGFDNPLIVSALEKGYQVGVILIRGMAGLFRWRIGLNRAFADDIAGRVKVVACLDRMPNLLHTDDRRPAALTARDRDALKELTGMSNEDCAVVVWGQPRDVETALNEIEIRVREALVGIPNETRKALSTGETDFERILPGPDRMYPDTDSPPLALTSVRVDGIRRNLPDRPWMLEEKYRQYRLPDHWRNRLIQTPLLADVFNQAIKSGAEPRFAAELLVDLLTRRKRLNPSLQQLSQDDLSALFAFISEVKLNRSGVRLLIEKSAEMASTDWQTIAKKSNLIPATAAEIDTAIKGALKQRSQARTDKLEALRRFLMGQVMQVLRGRVDGSLVANRLAAGS